MPPISQLFISVIHTPMPPEQPPQGPKPPEYGSPSEHTLYIALIGLLSARMRERHTLLHAPVKHIDGVALSSQMTYLKRADDDELQSIELLCKELRQFLDQNLGTQEQIGKESRLQFEIALLNRIAIENPEQIDLMLDLFALLWDDFESKGLRALEDIAFPLIDQTFIDRFGYNAVIQGLDNEVLALLPKSEDRKHPPLYLGMTVFYTKKLPPSGGTGPDLGEGKIASFFPPTGKIPIRNNMAIPDQVIELEIKTEQGVVRSQFSTDEVSLMPPLASSKD